MGRGSKSLIAIAALAGVLAFSSGAMAQTAPAENAAPTADNAVMLTIFLKHDQSRPLGELNAHLDKQGYYKTFPPAGIEVVSWYVMMGIGQVVTLRLPASRLRDEEDPEPGYEGLIPFSARNPDGYFLGWTPGQAAHIVPEGTQWRLDPGSDLIVQLHLQPTGKPESVQVSRRLPSIR